MVRDYILKADITSDQAFYFWRNSAKLAEFGLGKTVSGGKTGFWEGSFRQVFAEMALFLAKLGA